jgi:sporulation protein YlmC with PRC-barrel domain
MRLKEIRGLPVVDPTAARKIGMVTDYLVDPVSGRLAALEIQPMNGSGESSRVPAHRIRRVGRHAVVLTGRAVANGSTGPLDTAGATERWLDAASLVNLEVLGDDGNRIGRLTDARFDQDTLDIQAYLLRSSLWDTLIRRRWRIQPTQVASCSRELMIVTTGHMSELPPFASSGDEATARLGMPLKLEDRLPAPASSTEAEDGQAVPASGRHD